MVYQGRVENGVIVFTGEARLPEGAEVRIEAVGASEPLTNGEAVPALYDALRPLIGILKDAPPDLARNHDHYLYGVPKRA